MIGQNIILLAALFNKTKGDYKIHEIDNGVLFHFQISYINAVKYF